MGDHVSISIRQANESMETNADSCITAIYISSSSESDTTEDIDDDSDSDSIDLDCY